MHKSLFLFAVIVASLVACSAEEGAKKRTPGKLTEAEYDRLVKINSVQEDMIQAAALAFNDLIAPAAVSEKISKLSGKLAEDGKCDPGQRLPDEWFYGSPKTQEIKGTDCPIFWHRTRGRTSTSLVFADNLEIKTQEYANIAEMTGRRIDGALYKTAEGAGNVIRSGGDGFEIGPFQVNGHGPVQGKIVIMQTYKAGTGKGSLDLTIRGNGWGHKATVTWTFKAGEQSALLFKIDNRRVEEKEFQTMFSSMEITKIVANVINMK